MQFDDEKLAVKFCKQAFNNMEHLLKSRRIGCFLCGYIFIYDGTEDTEPITIDINIGSRNRDSGGSADRNTVFTLCDLNVGNCNAGDALDLDDFDEAAAFVQHEDHDLWPEPEVVHEEQALDRTFSGEVAPLSKRRRTTPPGTRRT